MEKYLRYNSWSGRKPEAARGSMGGHAGKLLVQKLGTEHVHGYCVLLHAIPGQLQLGGSW